ncbi:ribosome maturation factor RimP [Kineococcus xinjiangensis]|uniref:Ribosome maturation factor RimP n=1 Tax=Kineococcus xinjiangensis TaxID=512762 RepID=A0A2S6IW42_9ACTN|nr:ribosome maturation factor RimP [Kineococcus xinjiangensis]PPK98496.1 ribosome maturation factor RimP [Kineococcus xinjiangensis]
MPPSGPSAKPPLTQEVAGVLSVAVAGVGLVLDDVEITTAGRRRIVRVVVDLPEDRAGEVDLDAVAAASTAVSEALDSSDVLGATPYVLEVTSPGVERPLVERRHWSRARGRLVRAVLADGRVLVGRVLDVGDDGVVLDVQPQSVKGRPPSKSAPRGEHLLAWADLVRGEVQVEFSRPGEDDLDEDLDDDLDDGSEEDPEDGWDDAWDDEDGADDDEGARPTADGETAAAPREED